MRRARGYGRGDKIFTPPDFVDFGSRAAVDQALSRLVRDGDLRRLGRGLYDWPRHSKLLGRTAPAAPDDVAAAVGRRAGAATAPDNLAAANALGLTTAVLSRPAYASTKRIGDRAAAGVKIKFRPIGAKLAPLLDTDAAVIVQALAWARDGGFDLHDAAETIARNASLKAKAALAANLRRLPVWALAPAQQILGIVR
ncbi:MAG: hypothetical protein HY054_07655 [Proteobacteria bacterium]|nr:hypothetical protein [Pseudomonadota bacterium]